MSVSICTTLFSNCSTLLFIAASLLLSAASSLLSWKDREEISSEQRHHAFLFCAFCVRSTWNYHALSCATSNARRWILFSYLLYKWNEFLFQLQVLYAKVATWYGCPCLWAFWKNTITSPTFRWIWISMLNCIGFANIVEIGFMICRSPEFEFEVEMTPTVNKTTRTKVKQDKILNMSIAEQGHWHSPDWDLEFFGTMASFSSSYRGFCLFLKWP